MELDGIFLNVLLQNLMICDVSEAAVGLANGALLILQPFRRRFKFVTSTSPTSPGEPPMLHNMY